MNAKIENPAWSEDFDFDFRVLFDDNFGTGEDAQLLIDLEPRDRGVKKRRSHVASSGWEVAEVAVKKRRKGVKRKNDADKSETETVIQSQHSQNKKRNFAEYKLYIFAKSAVLTLPKAFAALFNSSNIAQLSTFMLPLTTRDCEMNVQSLGDDNISANTFLRFYDLITQLYPDSVVCVDSADIEDNKIRASISMSYTSSKIIHESIALMAAGDPLFAPVFTTREASLNRVIRRVDTPEHEKDRLCARTGYDGDLVVCAAGEMILTIDELTSKVSKLAIRGRLVSIEPVERPVSRGDDNMSFLV